MFILHTSVLDNSCRHWVREVTKAIFFLYIEPRTYLLQDMLPSLMWQWKWREIKCPFYMWCKWFPQHGCSYKRGITSTVWFVSVLTPSFFPSHQIKSMFWSVEISITVFSVLQSHFHMHDDHGRCLWERFVSELPNCSYFNVFMMLDRI